jgi:hypothetical protein
LRPFDAVVLKALARSPEDRFANAAEFLEALSLAQAGGPVSADQTVIVARRLLEPGGYAGSGGSAGANETLLIPRRPAAADDPANLAETLLVPRRSEPDKADYTLIRPVPTRYPDALTEPLPPPPVLEPFAEAAPPSQPQPVNTQSFEAQAFVAQAVELQAVDAPPVDTPSPAPGWTAAELTQIEKHLARFVGPIAGIWVRSGARETNDLVTLIQCLAAKFGEPADRDAFLRGFGVTPTFAPAPNHSDADAEVRGNLANGGVPLTPEYIERAARLLAVHLGPIATVLAKRAAQPGSSQEQFVDTLCTHLRDDGERTRFLRTLA